MGIIKDATDITNNTGKIITGIKGLFAGLAAAYIIAIPVHDIWTGESLLSKTWNSAIVANVDDTKLCGKSKFLENSFVCKKRGNGAGMETLKPSFLK